jgi:hypothetical protein
VHVAKVIFKHKRELVVTGLGDLFFEIVFRRAVLAIHEPVVVLDLDNLIWTDGCYEIDGVADMERIGLDV